MDYDLNMLNIVNIIELRWNLVSLEVLLLCAGWVVGSGGQQTGYMMEEKRNATYQLQNYIRNLDVVRDKVAPLKVSANGNLSVLLKASVAVMYIRGVNDAEQTATTSSFIQMSWRDAMFFFPTSVKLGKKTSPAEALAWNRSLYSDIAFIEVTADVIWTPGVIIANSIETMKANDFIDTMIIHSDGEVETKVFLSIETFCPLDHTLFPYDEQQCPIILYAFSNYIEWNVSTQAWTNSAEAKRVLASNWDLLKATPAQMYLPQYQKTMPLVVLRLKRKTVYYSVCLILPMVLTSYMNTLVFLLPHEAGEKISYLVTIFVSTSVFIGFFSDTMPRGLDEMTSSMKMLILGIVESLLVLLATLLVLRVFHRQKATAKSKVSSFRQGGLVTELSQSSRKLPNKDNIRSATAMTDREPDQIPDLLGSKKDRQGLSVFADRSPLEKSGEIFSAFGFRRLSKQRQQVSPTSLGPEGKDDKVRWRELELAACEAEGKPRGPGWCSLLTANHLDAFFFLLFFFTNTVAHGVILFNELHVGAKPEGV